jgi:hypothetical protein
MLVKSVSAVQLWNGLMEFLIRILLENRCWQDLYSSNILHLASLHMIAGLIWSVAGIGPMFLGVCTDMRKAMPRDVEKKSVIPMKRAVTPEELEYDWKVLHLSIFLWLQLPKATLVLWVWYHPLDYNLISVNEDQRNMGFAIFMPFISFN